MRVSHSGRVQGFEYLQILFGYSSMIWGGGGSVSISPTYPRIFGGYSENIQGCPRNTFVNGCPSSMYHEPTGCQSPSQIWSKYFRYSEDVGNYGYHEYLGDI